MILNRFCSQKEFEAYMRGEILRNTAYHHCGDPNGKPCRGFCFFHGDVKQWARRLNGLVDFDVLITVEADRDKIIPTRAPYVDWENDTGNFPPPKKLFREYCMTSYSMESLKFISASAEYRDTYISLSVLVNVFGNETIY